jgi:hypothetical protein
MRIKIFIIYKKIISKKMSNNNFLNFIKVLEINSKQNQKQVNPDNLERK